MAGEIIKVGQTKLCPFTLEFCIKDRENDPRCDTALGWTTTTLETKHSEGMRSIRSLQHPSFRRAMTLSSRATQPAFGVDLSVRS